MLQTRVMLYWHFYHLGQSYVSLPVHLMEPPHQYPSPVPLPKPSPQVISQEALTQAPQGTSPPPSAQLLRGVNDALIHAMTTHFDKGLAAHQNALLERISIQDSALVKQQQFLASISRDISAIRDESTQTREILSIEVRDLHAKTDKLVDESMKLLATGTFKGIHECQAITEQRLACVEESLESLNEKINNPRENCTKYLISLDHPLLHEAAQPSRMDPNRLGGRQPSGMIGLRTRARTCSQISSHYLALRLLCQPSNVASAPSIAILTVAMMTTDVSVTALPITKGYLLTRGDVVVNPLVPMSSTTHVETANPLDIPDPRVASASFIGSSSEHDLRWQADIETSGIRVYTGSPAQSKATGNLANFSKPPFHVTTSPLSFLDSLSSSEQVVDNLFCAVQTENLVSCCLSRSTNTSAPGSTIASTVSLPEPTALLDEFFSKPRNKAPETAVPPIQVLVGSEQLGSMSSERSSISSDGVPLVAGGTLSGPTTNSLGGKSESTGPSKGTRTPKSANKRRRSSPGPVRVKTAKRARRQATTGKTKKMKQELLNGSTAMIIGDRKKSTPSSSRGPWPEMRAANEAGSRQVFVFCQYMSESRD